MTIYLKEDLTKAAERVAPARQASTSSPTADKTGEERGGKYAARVQTGFDKDGSPQYRYFKTQDQYRQYLETKGRASQGQNQRTTGKVSDDRKKKDRDSKRNKLEDKVKQQGKKQSAKISRKRKEALTLDEKKKSSKKKANIRLDSDKSKSKKSNKKKMEKAMPLYLGVKNER